MSINKKNLANIIIVFVVIVFWTAFLVNVLIWLITDTYIDVVKMLQIVAVATIAYTCFIASVGKICMYAQDLRLMSQEEFLADYHSVSDSDPHTDGNFQLIAKCANFMHWEDEKPEGWDKNAPIPYGCPTYVEFQNLLRVSKIPYDLSGDTEENGKMIIHVQRGGTPLQKLNTEIHLHHYSSESGWN